MAAAMMNIGCSTAVIVSCGPSVNRTELPDITRTGRNPAVSLSRKGRAEICSSMETGPRRAMVLRASTICSSV